MPIIIKDFDWKETQHNITIHVSLRGVHQSKVDIFCSKGYLKATFEIFYFEVFLLNMVDIENSKCSVTDSEIIFELVKLEPILWGVLEKKLEKYEKMDLKRFFFDEVERRQHLEKKEIEKKKREMKSLSVTEQISLDSKERDKIESLKEKEKLEAFKFIKWGEDKSELNKKNYNVTNIHTNAPPIRSTRTVEVTFAQREFPTPIRESNIELENEWLRKKREARRTAGFFEEDIRVEERNPLYLKIKGDEFMKNENYLGAISAYTYGLQINCEYSELYEARALAHFLIGNFHKTIQDCTVALNLMNPIVQQNLKSRSLCIGRRGLALAKIGLIEQGISELENSLRLLPNEYFQSELNKIKHFE